LLDPYRPQALGGRIQFDAVDTHANIVAVTHYHEDHGWIGGVHGNPTVMDAAGTAHGIAFKTVTLPHDCEGGSTMGLSRMIAFEVDEIRVLHPGDLGRLPTEEERNELGPIDLLLLPMGGKYTIGSTDAATLCEQLSPRWVVPMHYRSSKVDLDMAPRSEFLEALPATTPIIHHTKSVLTCQATARQETMEVHLLEPSR